LAELFKTKVEDLTKPCEFISSVAELKLMNVLERFLEKLENAKEKLSSIIEKSSGSAQFSLHAHNFYVRVDCQITPGNLLKQLLAL
jgi:hypothetical protein